MSYRNDHDAALTRIDALELELEQQKAAAAVAKVVVPPKRYAMRMAALAGIAASAMGGYWLLHRTHERAVVSASAPVLVDPMAAVDGLRPCVARVLAVRGDGYDARTTDPRGAARPVAPAAAVGASCRRELADVMTTIGLTAEQRAAFQRWLTAEDQLAGDLSRIAVYYANDPYQLDNYASATQLWREYQTDRSARDATLPAVVRELGQPNS